MAISLFETEKSFYYVYFIMSIVVLVSTNSKRLVCITYTEGF